VGRAEENRAGKENRRERVRKMGPELRDLGKGSSLAIIILPVLYEPVLLIISCAISCDHHSMIQ
jgi:hypothetical protein